MLWLMSADLRRQGIGMTFINHGAARAATRASSAAGKGRNPFPRPWSGAQEFPVFPPGLRARSCLAAGRRPSKPLAEIAENAENPASRPLGRGRRKVLRADTLPLGVDLAQHDQHLLGDDVARDALALGLELLHVDPHRIERRRALGDDAGMQQRLDQHAEDVVAFLELGAAIVVAEDLL